MLSVFDQIDFLKPLWLAVVGEEQEKLRKKIDELERAFLDSICICEICQTLDKDMIFIPKNKDCYCIDCFRNNLIYFEKKIYRYY
jgi:hypothetical protein